MHFGDVLRSLRKRHEMTQHQLGEALGVSESTIGMYERGHREPDFETLEAIADYFNVDMDYLTGRNLQERAYSIPPGFEPTPEELSDGERFVIDRYRRVNGTGKEYIRQQAEIALHLYDGEKAADTPLAGTG